MRLFAETRVPITKPLLIRWAVWSAGLAVAQAFRTDVEQVVAGGFTVAASVLAWSALSGRASPAFIGFAVAAVASFARAGSAPWLPTAWHGALIIVVAWLMYCYLMAERALSAYRILKGEHDGPR